MILFLAKVVLLNVALVAIGVVCVLFYAGDVASAGALWGEGTAEPFLCRQQLRLCTGSAGAI